MHWSDKGVANNLAMGDAWLVEQDVNLPGLEILLDTSRFVQRMALCQPQQSITHGRAYYVRYKPGTSCLVAYQLVADGEPLWVYATAYQQQEQVKLAKARKHGLLPDLIWEDAMVVVRCFPDDRHLCGLQYLQVDKEDNRITMGSKLAQRLGLGEDSLSLEIIRYKPERRLVARAQHDEQQWIVRYYCDDDYQAAKNAYRALAHINLPLARCVGKSDKAQALALNWLPGCSLDEVTAQGSAWHNAGRLLRQLHAQHAPKLKNVQLTHAASQETILTLRPHLRSQVERLTEGFQRTLANTHQHISVVHGDFSADQCLVQPDSRMLLLDLDAAAWGDPMADLGNFAAQLDQLATLGQWPIQQATAAIQQCLIGYCDEDCRQLIAIFDPARFAAHRGLRLLRLAPEPFRYRSPAWPEAVEATVAAAEKGAYVSIH